MRTSRSPRRIAVAALCLLALSAAAAPAGAARQPDYAGAAQNAYNGMQAYLYVSGTSLYHETYPADGDNPYSYHWPFSQAMSGTIDMSLVPGLRAAQLDNPSPAWAASGGSWGGGADAAAAGNYPIDIADRLVGLSKYWDAAPSFGLPGYDSYVVPPYGGGGDKFYDDNAWSGLGLERAYRLTGNTAALAQAEKVFAFEQTGWATNTVCSTPPQTGGEYWKQQTPSETNHDRNTVSDAPNAELALRLYQITGRQTYLDTARSMYSWVQANLKDSDGLYWDHYSVAADGSCVLEPTKWSYNQGTMIGAGVLLYQITGDRSYLDQARSSAGAALAYYGCSPTCGAKAPIFQQDPIFNAIFFRNLLFLSSIDGSSLYRQAMQSYADSIWNDRSIHQTSRRGDLFSFQSGSTKLLDQAAMVQIYACLAMNGADYDKLV